MKFQFGGGIVSVLQEAFTCDTTKEFPEVIGTTAEDPASKTLFDMRESSKKNTLLGPK